MCRALFVAIAAILSLAAAGATAQENEAGQPQSRIASWAFDPIRGMMVATPAAPYFAPGKPDATEVVRAATSPAVYTGTIKMVVTVKLISKLPAGSTVNCSGGVGLQYSVIQSNGGGTLSSGGILQSSESNAATLTSTAATCSFVIPYSWTVPGSSASTLVTLSGISGSVSVFASSPAGGIGVSRSTQVELIGPTTIPENGTTTTLKASTVL